MPPTLPEACRESVDEGPAEDGATAMSYVRTITTAAYPPRTCQAGTVIDVLSVDDTIWVWKGLAPSSLELSILQYESLRKEGWGQLDDSLDSSPRQ